MSKKRLTPEDEPHLIVRSFTGDVPDKHEIARHAHDWHQLIYAAVGVMTVWTEQGSWVAPPRWAIWAPARISHSIRFAGHASVRTLYLRPEEWADLPNRCTVIGVSPLLRELIVRAVEIGALDRREPIHLALSTLIVDALNERPTPPFDLPTPASPDLRRIAEQASDDRQRDWSNVAMARRFGIALRTLERRFLAETGLSFGSWRRQASLLRALRQLAAGASVKAAALDAGYSSASAFVVAFREAFHTTPGRYFEVPASK